jgi:hypothetical protein
MSQKLLHSRDTLARTPDVPSLTAVASPRTCQTIIGTKNDCAAAENIDGGRGRAVRATLQDSPADGAVTNIECQLEIGNNLLVIHDCGLYHKFGIKTKLDNADQLLLAKRARLVQKRFYKS